MCPLNDSRTWWWVRNVASRTGYVLSNYTEKQISMKKGSLMKNPKET